MVYGTYNYPEHPHLKKFNRTWFFQSPLENCKNSIVFCFFQVQNSSENSIENVVFSIENSSEISIEKFVFSIETEMKIQ